MTEHEHDKTALTLVLGGTGKTGGRVAERLTARHRPVRIGSRSGEPPFDWADRASWAPALHGVTSAYLSFYPDLAVPGAADAIRSFTDLAVRHGVRRLVLLSGRGEEEAQLSEEVIMNSGVQWTIVRASWFNQNFSEGHLLDPVRGGELVLPVGDVGEPFVDTDDIADVAVAALTEDGHTGQLYEVTGPRLLTFAEAVGEIAAATGRDVRFRSVTIEEYAGMLAEYQLPADEVALLTYLFTEVLDGRNAHLGDGVERALARPARDFRDYARSTASTGVWAG
ncbi:NAD(P)H-binding protein [Plantactinospora soyae]|uniref:Uncharacterized protein YbjT (DUF2867 family) n=1 Tax=Plantactinospora soyae TaxID=1544732 RepID=A0A927RBD1_9ACTN|nr:NAD(P)H-binding protein [Plantactinospora soyae]MBE1491566.1 uncharacterized protein YbjT (DUF2867 family) [Plantactinospora soyae]